MALLEFYEYISDQVKEKAYNLDTGTYHYQVEKINVRPEMEVVSLSLQQNMIKRYCQIFITKEEAIQLRLDLESAIKEL